MDQIQHTLFAILRSALGIEKMTSPVSLEPRQWKRLAAMASGHQVSALVYGELATVGSDMPYDVRNLLQACHQFVQGRFDAQLMAMTHLSAMLEEEKVRMMVLKGIGLALTYPRPQLRECVDIDIYCYDDYQRVNEYVMDRGIDKDAAENGVKEFCFKFGGIEVENHGNFTTDCNDANRFVGKVLKQMCVQLPPIQDPRIPDILMPAPQMGALHLVMHTLSHLAWSGIALRHLCDVTMYFRAHMDQIDLQSLRSVLGEAGLEKASSMLLDICSRYLGLDIDLSDWDKYGQDAAKTILHSIFHPFKASGLTRNPLRKFHRKAVMFRTRRRLHRIVYGEEFPDKFLSSFACLR